MVALRAQPFPVQHGSCGSTGKTSSQQGWDLRSPLPGTRSGRRWAQGRPGVPLPSASLAGGAAERAEQSRPVTCVSLQSSAPLPVSLPGAAWGCRAGVPGHRLMWSSRVSRRRKQQPGPIGDLPHPKKRELLKPRASSWNAEPALATRSPPRRAWLAQQQGRWGADSRWNWRREGGSGRSRVRPACWGWRSSALPEPSSVLTATDAA